MPFSSANPAPGSRPEGVEHEQVPQFVRGMFDRIAPRYDRANHWLSLGVDHYWRRRAAVEVCRLLPRRGVLPLLDVCCGTGDMALALWRRVRHIPGAPLLLGADFSGEMLRRGQRKARQRAAAIQWLNGDAMQLPFAAAGLAAISTAFGFRNLADYRRALGGFHQLLTPGGVLAILEFSQPSVPLMGPLFRWYFHHVLPFLSGLLGGDKSAYRYLPASVDRFPSPAELADWMRDAGFSHVRYLRLTGGIAVLHLGVK